MARILVIDDDAGFRASLVETLQSMGHATEEASGSPEALAKLAAQRFDAMILDYRLGHERGTDLLREAAGAQGATLPAVLVLTAYSDPRGTIEAMQLGAFDHLAKPVSRAQIEEFLRRALASGDGAHAGEARPAGASPGTHEAHRLIGGSAAMRDVLKLIGRAAASDTTVLITGETGTGKEVAARTLHEFSKRSKGPFIAVNCAAIPADLLESELFGHAKGAFSGAVTARAGCFEQADCGTLLLDEIGDMPLPMQAKILRVLQERCVTRLGEATERSLDVRIVAATHRDLEEAVRSGIFRADLYFRLNVVPIALPPLRERREDIVPLAQRFLNRDGGTRHLTADAQALLTNAAWPGNVRQLRNAMERVRVVVPGSVVEAADLSFIDTGDALQKHRNAKLSSAVATVERDLVVAALAEARGNRSEAARRLGISRAQLYRKLRALGIEDVP